MADFVAVVAVFVVILPVQFSVVLRFDGGGLWRILSQLWRFLS